MVYERNNQNGWSHDVLADQIRYKYMKDKWNVLIELGNGFAFVGNQYKITVSDTDYYIDLLFYHLELRCYVVVELKARKFKPTDAGQLNFYLSAIDDMLEKMEIIQQLEYCYVRKKTN